MEKLVSTNSATAFLVRASVSTTSMSPSWMPIDAPSVRSPAAAVRWIALVMVRVVSQAAVSPNSQGRVPPVGSPVWPARRESRLPGEARCVETSRSSSLPSIRIALGDSCRLPCSPLFSKPDSRSAFSRSRSVFALVAASLPKRSATSSRSRSGRAAFIASASSSRRPRSRMARVASPSPMPSPSPSNDSDPYQSRSGRMPRRFASSSPMRFISSSEPNAWADSAMSSWRCSGVIELSRRWAAAERWASSSTSSSMFLGCSGNWSPCLAMNSVKSCSVAMPARCFASSTLRSRSISATAARSSSVAFSSMPFMPSKRWSSSSRPTRSRIWSYFSRASLDAQS